MVIKYYLLSPAADQDLEDIFDYSETTFGLDQAIEYLTGLDELFKQLVLNPQLGNSRNEIKHGLRSIPKVSHTVFYRIIDDHIRIVRVLHGCRDLVRFLDKD